MLEALCPWEPATYLFFSSNVPNLVHYSHIVAILSALGIGIFIYASNPKSPVSRLMVLFVFLVTTWTVLNVILWATNRPDMVMFAWSLQVLIEPLTYTIAFYLFYMFLYKRLPRFWINVGIVSLLVPLLILLPTTYTLQALSLSACEAIEGPVAKYYTYAVHVILMIGIAFIGTRKIVKFKKREKRIIAFCFGFGLVAFLLSFTSGNFLGSFTDDWTISQYGLFGMPFFGALIVYSAIRFHAFNAKVIGAKMLVTILAIGVGSLVALQSIRNVRVVASLTFVLVCVLGYILVRSVKREIEQRERVEKLANDLEAANERLKELDQMKSEFLSIASHQLRAPITAIKGYISLIREGDYGVVPDTMKQPLENVAESVRIMVSSIEDYLNVSRIEQKRMKYEISDVDIADVATKAVSELQPVALARKLTLSVTAPAKAVVSADIGKIKQVITNLIDNAIKYTEQGSVSVSVEQNTDRTRVTIADTGVGIAPEDIGNLFQKFKRAAGANAVNTSGTGLGLYVARLLIEGHGGRVWAESEGKGKGSRFIIEIPAEKKTPAPAPVSSEVIPPPPRA